MRNLSITAIVMLLTLSQLPSASAEEFGGVEFPLGSLSFADAVVSFSMGSDSNTFDPTVALGIPTGIPDALSLGNQGVLVVEFVDNLLVDQDSVQDGHDLFIFEASSQGGVSENFMLEISTDNVTYINLGEYLGASGVDIKPFINPGEVFRYVRITDLEPNNTTFPTAGADIDAVGAIGSIAVPQTQKLYWTDSGTNKIQRANLDGSNIEDVVTSGLQSPLGLALDSVDQKIYWTDEGTDWISRANFDGSNIENLLFVQHELSGIGLDEANGNLYFANRNPSEIAKANLDGSNPTTLTNIVVNVRSMAVDSAGQRVYWTEEGIDGGVYSADLDGSNIDQLAIGLEMRGLALDVADDKMYWVDNGGPMFDPVIKRADLDGSNVEVIVTDPLLSLQGLALDSIGGKLYWVDRASDKIRCANLDGTDVEDVVTTGLSSPSALAIASVTTFVLGDVNLDGAVNLLDVGPFIDLVATTTYQVEADINQDGIVNLLDVSPFIDILGS